MTGTAPEAIVFTSIADSGGNQWGGIYFYPGSTGVVQHAEFRYGGGAYIAGMIQIDDARVTVQNVTFLNSGENGLHVSNINDPQRVVIRQCAFVGNAGNGIQCDTASPTIVGCSFTNNGATAIRLTGTSSPDFNGDLTAPTDGIHLSGATLEANAHWEYAGIPYILDGTIEVPTNTSPSGTSLATMGRCRSSTRCGTPAKAIWPGSRLAQISRCNSRQRPCFRARKCSRTVLGAGRLLTTRTS